MIVGVGEAEGVKVGNVVNVEVGRAVGVADGIRVAAGVIVRCTDVRVGGEVELATARVGNAGVVGEEQAAPMSKTRQQTSTGRHLLWGCDVMLRAECITPL